MLQQVKQQLRKAHLAAAALVAFSAFSSAQAADAYVKVDHAPSAQPQVVEFFSFYCPHCYSFEYNEKIPEKVAAALPKDVKFKQYFLNLGYPQDALLAKAWALAMALGVEDKVRQPLFEVAQKAVRSRNFAEPTLAQVKQIFLDAGVSEAQFNALDSFSVNALVNQQAQLAKELNVHGVPDFYVNNQYRINPEALPRTPEGFVQGYVNTIKELLQK